MLLKLTPAIPATKTRQPLMDPSGWFHFKGRCRKWQSTGATDARYVFTEKTKDHGVARAGVRFTF